MKKLVRIAFFVFASSVFGIGQTPIDGVINQYTAVIDIDDMDCLARLEVVDTAGFVQGMEVILIQMKGASIDESNTATFGSASLGGAGLYEKNEVDSVAAGEVFLKFEILHDYHVDGKVQLVSVPSYTDAIITSKLTAQDWDGSTGGILAFSVTNTLTMNANVDVTGKGFRGGIAQTNLPNDCSWLFQQDDYYYGFNSWRGAPKGEGVAEFINGKEAGKGPQANGGGGGNDHNSGGGGGAHVTLGGAGGENEEPSTFGCKGQHPGLGGRALPQLNERFYLGGGGGAGHGNNDVATNGGNGGGIVIMKVTNLVTNGFHFIANGESVPDGGGDGGGGGGAGGTLALFVENGPPMWMEVLGGDGGNIDNGGVDRCHGPGGGGSGGVILGSFPFTASDEVSGGIAGVSSNSGACSDSNNGALDGQDGIVVEVAQLNQGPEIISEIHVDAQPLSLETCIGDTLSFVVQISGNADFQWQVDQGSGFSDIADGALYNGTGNSELEVMGATGNMSGWEYRCVISNACDEITSEAALLNVFPELIVSPEIGTAVFCEGDSETLGFSADGSGLQFQWQVDEGNGFIDLADDTTYAGTTTQYLSISNATIALDSNFYHCLVTDTCGVQVSGGGLLILVETQPFASFSYSVNGGVADFSNESLEASDFEWDFGDNSGTSSAEHPQYEYSQNGIYTVQLIASNYCFSDTVELELEIDAENFPDVAISSDAVEGCAPLIVQFTDQSTENILSRNWSFPGGNPATSTEADPLVIYETPGVYDVTLEVTNSVGTASNTFENYITVLPPLFAGFTYTVDENEVSFTNTGPGGLAYQWDFGDGSPFSDEENPVHIYDEPGIYLVTLIVTNGVCGAAVSLSLDVLFTNLKDYTQEMGIHVYPNPTRENFILEWRGPGNPQSISLYDVSGTEIFSDSMVFPGLYTRNISALPGGVYVLEVWTPERVFVEKILKY